MWRYDPSAIQRIREKRGMGRRELSVQADVALNTIGRLERGEVGEPKPSTLAAFANVFGCTPREFFARDDTDDT